MAPVRFEGDLRSENRSTSTWRGPPSVVVMAQEKEKDVRGFPDLGFRPLFLFVHVVLLPERVNDRCLTPEISVLFFVSIRAPPRWSFYLAK